MKEFFTDPPKIVDPYEEDRKARKLLAERARHFLEGQARNVSSGVDYLLQELKDKGIAPNVEVVKTNYKDHNDLPRRRRVGRTAVGALILKDKPSLYYPE